MRLGPIIVRGEMIQAQRPTVGPTWHGEYAELGWLHHTGEKPQLFNTIWNDWRLSPDGRWNGWPWAWEVRWRWSKTDLSDAVRRPGASRGRSR